MRVREGRGTGDGNEEVCTTNTADGSVTCSTLILSRLPRVPRTYPGREGFTNAVPGTHQLPKNTPSKQNQKLPGEKK